MKCCLEKLSALKPGFLVKPTEVKSSPDRLSPMGDGTHPWWSPPQERPLAWNRDMDSRIPGEDLALRVIAAPFL